MFGNTADFYKWRKIEGLGKKLTIVLGSCFIDWTQPCEPASKQALILVFLTDFYIYRESILYAQCPTLLVDWEDRLVVEYLPAMYEGSRSQP